MRRLKIGDWVTTNEPWGASQIIGKCGKVIGLYVDNYLVQFNNWNSGHDGFGYNLSLGNKPKKGSTNCWYYKEYHLELSKEHRFKDLINTYNQFKNDEHRTD